MSDNLYRWREEVHQAVMEEPQCPSCRSTERNPSGSCQDCWHYWVPRNETKAMPKTIDELKEIVALCEFSGYSFLVRETHGGIILQAEYIDRDINPPHHLEMQVTRKWLISPYATKSEIVQTAFKCVLTSMEHRAREGFLYRGKRVFGPHFDVDALHGICDQIDARES